LSVTADMQESVEADVCDIVSETEMSCSALNDGVVLPVEADTPVTVAVT